jgi:hypothetical protein
MQCKGQMRCKGAEMQRVCRAGAQWCCRVRCRDAGAKVQQGAGAAMQRCREQRASVVQTRDTVERGCNKQVVQCRGGAPEVLLTAE